MNRISLSLTVLLACAFLLPGGTVMGAQDPSSRVSEAVPRLLPGAPDTTGSDIVFGPLWRFSPGDDSTWKSVDFDDRDWRLVNPVAGWKDEVRPHWTGIGWFRTRVPVDSGRIGMPQLLIVWQLGASEFYVDGKLEQSLGVVGATEEAEEYALIIRPESRSLILRRDTVVVAVRFSNHRIAAQDRVGAETFFLAGVTSVQRGMGGIVQMTNRLKILQFTFALSALVVSLIHLLIFFFNRWGREDQNNLYFALFGFSCAAIAYLPFAAVSQENIVWFIASITLFKVALVAVGITGARFLYGIFYTRLPRQFWVILGLGILFAGFCWTMPESGIYVFVVLVLVEMLRVLVVGIKHKKEGSLIIGVGSFCFIVLSLIQMLFDVGGGYGGMSLFSYPYLWGILILLISMSFSVARNIARTNLKLATQLAKVSDLSQRTLRQEREAKEQELRRKLLEQDLAHQAEQLKEAEKLEKALADLEKTHANLKRTQSQLIQSEKMASMGMLVAGVAHEINTPVGAISSMHNTLVRAMSKLRDSVKNQDSDSSSEASRAFKVIDDANRVIESGCERVTSIVRRLKSFARLDEAELKVVDIHEGIEDSLSMVHHQLKHHVTIVREYGDIPPIACYPGQLNQIFLNLFVNAGQAIVDKGIITINTRRDSNEIVIAISDTGAGIVPEKLDKVFDPGFTTKGVGVGTGLGLSICYQIIQDHRGEILVESRVGEGTTFTIKLPVNLDELVDDRGEGGSSKIS